MALAAAVVTAAATAVLARRGHRARAVAVAVGAPFAASTLAVWAAARHWGPVVFPDYGGPLLLGGWVVAALGVVFLQTALPAYAFARWRLASALPALVASAAATWYQFLLVGGETDVLWLWVVAFGPILVLGTLAVLGVEAGVRRVVGE